MTADVGRSIHVYRGAPLALVAGVDEKSITLAGEAVDITNDDSSGWRELLDKAGVNAVSIPVSGVLKNDTLRSEWFSQERLHATEFRYPDGAKVAGDFYLQEYTETGAHDDKITFEATFESSGVVTYTPAP